MNHSLPEEPVPHRNRLLVEGYLTIKRRGLTAVANSIDEALAFLQQWERSGRRLYVAEM
jgi:hypothetical protein